MQALQRTVLLLLVLSQSDLLYAKQRRAVPSEPNSPVPVPRSHLEPVKNKDPCPPGTVPHNNGSICCQPIACGKNQEVRICDVDGEEDSCSDCENGHIQPNIISSLDEDARCFKKGWKKCSGYDLKMYPTNWSDQCFLSCECRHEDCYWGDPCACKKGTVCGVNEQLNKTTGECEACPPYTYKNRTGCEPCTFNVTLWRSGLPSPTPTTRPVIESSSHPVNDTEKPVEEDDGDSEVNVVPQSPAASDKMSFILLIVLIVVVVVAIFVGIGVLMCWCYKRHGNAWFKPRLSCLSCMDTSSTSYGPVRTTPSFENTVVQIDANGTVNHQVLIPRKNGNLAINGIDPDNYGVAMAARIAEQYGRERRDNRRGGDNGGDGDGDDNIAVDVEINGHTLEGEQTVREGPLGAESDTPLLTPSGSSTSTVQTSLDSDRMSIPGQATRSDEVGNNTTGMSSAGVGSNVPKNGDSCLQCRHTRHGEAGNVDACGNVVFTGNQLKNCNVVLCCHKHAKHFVQEQDQTDQLESGDSSMKVAEMKSGDSSVKVAEMKSGDSSVKVAEIKSGDSSVKVAEMKSGDSSVKVAEMKSGDSSVKVAEIKSGDSSVKVAEMKSGDSSVKVAEMKSGIVPGRQTEGNTAAVRPIKPSRQSSNVSSGHSSSVSSDGKSDTSPQNVPGGVYWESNGSGKKPVAAIRPMQAVPPQSAPGTNDTNATSLPHSSSYLSSTSYQLLHHDPQYNRGPMVADVNDFESMVSRDPSEMNENYSNVNDAEDDIDVNRMEGIINSGGGVSLQSPTNHVCCNCCRTRSGTSCSQRSDCPQNFPGSVRPQPEGQSDIVKSVETGCGQSSCRRDFNQTFCKTASMHDDDETGLKSVDEDITDCKRTCDSDVDGAMCCHLNEDGKVAEEVSLCNNFEGKTNGTLGSMDESFEIDESEINRMLEVETMSEMTSEMRGEGTEALTGCGSDIEDDEANFSLDELDLGQPYGFVPPAD